MFISELIQGHFKKGTLKLQEIDGQPRRMAEAQIVIEPFSAELARELGDDLAGHLFTDAGDIREELEAIDLRVRPGLQALTVASHQELEPVAILSPVSIKDVSAEVKESQKLGTRWLAFSFTVVFSLEDKAARNFVLDHFGRTLLWSFRALQRELDGLAAVKEAGARLADVGDVTISSGGHSVHLGKGDAQRLRAEAKSLRERSH